MTDQFDAYYKWLGIPPSDQPPNHYRLLAIELFDNDPDVISGAADRQMAHLRTFQSGPHSAFSQKLLNEIAAARIVLLDPVRKTAYDDTLRASRAETLRASQAKALRESALAEALRVSQADILRAESQADALLASQAKLERQVKPLPPASVRIVPPAEVPNSARRVKLRSPPPTRIPPRNEADPVWVPLQVLGEPTSGQARGRLPAKRTSPAWRKFAIVLGLALVAGVVFFALSKNSEVANLEEKERLEKPNAEPPRPYPPKADAPKSVVQKVDPPKADVVAKAEAPRVAAPEPLAPKPDPQKPNVAEVAPNVGVPEPPAHNPDNNATPAGAVAAKAAQSKGQISTAATKRAEGKEIGWVLFTDSLGSFQKYWNDDDRDKRGNMFYDPTTAVITIDGVWALGGFQYKAGWSEFYFEIAAEQAGNFDVQINGATLRLGIGIERLGFVPVRIVYDDKSQSVAANLGGSIGRIVSRATVTQPTFLDNFRLSFSSSGGGIAKVRIRNVQIKLRQPDAPKADLPKADAAGLRSEKQPSVDLLAMLILDKHSFGGKWVFDGKTLVSPLDQQARIQIPYIVPKEYLLKLKIERKHDQQNMGFLIGLVAGGSPCAVWIDGWSGKITGLEMIDGKRADANETTRRGAVLTTGKPSTIVCTVRQSAISVVVDDKPVIDFKGSFARMSLQPGRTVPNPQALYIGSCSTNYRIIEMDLVPLSENVGPISR